MPFSFACHGRNHKIHPVWCPHIRCIFPKTYSCDFHLWNFSSDHILKCIQHDRQVSVKNFWVCFRIYLSDRSKGFLKNLLHLLLLYRMIFIFIDPPDKLCEKNRPCLTDRYDFLPIQYHNRRHYFSRQKAWWNKVNPHHIFRARIPRCVNRQFPIFQFIYFFPQHIHSSPQPVRYFFFQTFTHYFLCTVFMKRK